MNEKIEGFFDVCVACGGLSATGVIIPWQNKVNLMLREDVVQAIKKTNSTSGRYERSVEILTGMSGDFTTGKWKLPRRYV